MVKNYSFFNELLPGNTYYWRVVLQDSNLDTSLIISDLDFKPTPLESSLKYCLNQIGDNWDFYLNAREETVVKLQAE